ncbi:MAG: Trm112 family protein [Sphingobium sp.]
MSDGPPIDPWLLGKLACPVTRTALRWDPVRSELLSDEAGLAFPVRDGVPLLVIRDARVI